MRDTIFEQAQYCFDQNYHHHAKTEFDKNQSNGLSKLAFALNDMAQKIDALEKRLAKMESGS
jgi:hypothetical protein